MNLWNSRITLELQFRIQCHWFHQQKFWLCTYHVYILLWSSSFCLGIFSLIFVSSPPASLFWSYCFLLRALCIIEHMKHEGWQKITMEERRICIELLYVLLSCQIYLWCNACSHRSICKTDICGQAGSWPCMFTTIVIFLKLTIYFLADTLSFTF